MKLSNCNSACRLAVLALAALLPCQAWTQPSTSPIRVAIIAEPGEFAAVADLLTVELARKPQVQLLERAQIAKVYREQNLATANRNFVQLGQILGADGLLLMEMSGEGTNRFLQARLVAVKPGVIISAIRLPWPVEDSAAWARGLGSHLEPLLEKLSVLPGEAIPISVVNLRSAVRSGEAETLERQLTALTIERLSRERELFVLERRRLELLSGEKELKDMGESSFWNGSYLLEGVIDRDSYAKDRLTIHARLVPPAGATPVELTIEGPRENLNKAMEQLTGKTLAALKRSASATAWKPEAEAQKYFEEAKWAMRWQMIPEAQSALESSWALGQRSKETDELRIRAWLGTGLNGNYCNIQRERGQVTFGRPFVANFFDGTQINFSSPPNSKAFDDMVYTLTLFDHGFEAFESTQPKLDPEWLALGNSLLVEATAWLRQYYFTVEARAGREDQIASARNLVSKIHAAMQHHPGCADTDKNHDLLATRVIGGVFWDEKPEQTVGWYQKIIQADQWPRVRGRFLNNGHFRQEAQTRVSGLNASDNTDPARPPLGGWKWEDRRRAPAVWAKFVDDLCAATNALNALEGRFIRCSAAWTGEEFERRLKELLEAVRQQREAISAAKQDGDWLRDLGLLVNGRLGALESARAKRIKEEIWKNFESRFKDLQGLSETRPTSPAPTAVPPPTPAQPSPLPQRPPGAAAVQAPRAHTNHLQVDRFRSPKDFGWSWQNPTRVTVSDACARDQRLWFQVQYEEFDSSGHLEAQCLIITGDEDLRSGESISLKEQIPSRDGIFLKRLPTRTFEVLNGHLYFSTGNGLRKYSLRDRTWQTLPTPVSGPLRLQRLDNRLFAVTDDSILELNPDGSSAKILASNRRQPPVAILDGVQDYGMPQLFSLGKGDIRVLVKGKGYVLPRGGSDWEITDLPQGASLAAAYEDGLFLGTSLPGNRGGLWGMFRGRENMELLFMQGSSLRAPQPPFGAKPPAQETPKPRWNLPGGLPPLNSPVPDGTNLWLFTGGLAIESRAGRPAVKEENGSNGLLLGFLPDAAEPLVIPLRLGFVEEVVPRQEMARLFGTGGFGERLLRSTPKGLVLTRAGLPGFWFIPRTELERRIADFRNAQPNAAGGPAKH